MDIRKHFVVLLLVFLASCSWTKRSTYERRIDAYQMSTDSVFLDHYYISLPIRVLKENDTYTPENRKGYVVLYGVSLYRLIFEKRFSRMDFSNYIFRLMVSQRDLLVSQEQYEMLIPYLISLDDGDRFSNMNSKKILRAYSEEKFLPSINVITPDYKGRCILHHLVNNGYTVHIDDESGYLELW
ncbi:MAG: hypothetical protein JNL72_06370 [Flavipsychrobacter sp.]|nr:hypothetical protein [Flavipsychrobacter sp.]